jgi:hypothetical protein
MSSKVSVAVNTGFVYSVAVRFSQTDSQARIYIMSDSGAIVLDNLTAKEDRDATYLHEGIFQTATVNQSKQCSLKILVYWVFWDNNNMDHSETVTAEITYFDGATFRMATMPIQLGMFAAITDVKTAETSSWNMSRPSYLIESINQSITNSYTDSEISARMNISINGYFENFLGPPAWGDDHMSIRLVSNVNISAGLIHSQIVRFSRTDALADLVFELPSFPRQNASEREAYTQTIIQYRTKVFSSAIPIYWVFLDPNDTNHSVTANLEITYTNGTTYKKLIVPIILEVLVG